MDHYPLVIVSYKGLKFPPRADFDAKSLRFYSAIPFSYKRFDTQNILKSWKSTRVTEMPTAIGFSLMWEISVNNPRLAGIALNSDLIT